MHKTFLLIAILVTASVNSVAQSRKFLAILDSIAPIYFEENRSPTKDRMQPHEFDRQHSSALVIGGINKRRNQRGRDYLVQDTLLNQFCEAGLRTFFKSKFKSHTTWRKEQKGVLRALNMKRSKHKLFTARAFNIDLLDWPMTAQYFFLKNGRNTIMRLYKGKQPPSTNPVVDGYVEPVPIDPTTEKLFVWRLLEVFPNKGTQRDILSRRYDRIGVAIQVDPRTLDREKRPTANVLLILAGKRMQRVKVKRFVEDGMAEEDSYE